MSPRKKASRVREAHATYAVEAPAPESMPETEARAEARLSLRIDPELKELIERAALHTGQTVSSYAISTLVRDARRVIQDEHTTYLSERDWEIFMDLMDNPPAPGEALLRAKESYHKLIVPRTKPIVEA
ncbi:MAG TPA: DUF1778 domain-containing protein [Longimicrobium sp.]|nr:DUF1778 domain-containing protein [Longimicrobium sp.]